MIHSACLAVLSHQTAAQACRPPPRPATGTAGSSVRHRGPLAWPSDRPHLQAPRALCSGLVITSLCPVLTHSKTVRRAPPRLRLLAPSLAKLRPSAARAQSSSSPRSDQRARPPSRTPRSVPCFPPLCQGSGSRLCLQLHFLHRKGWPSFEAQPK